MASRWARSPFRRANPQAAGLCGHNGTSAQLFAMQLKDVQANRRLANRRDIDDPQNPGMRLIPDDGKLAEVLVQGHQDSLLLMGSSQDFFIAGIFVPVGRSDHIMTGSRKLGACPAPDATVQEKPHPSVPVGMSSGSTRSCPTSRRA